MGNGKVLMLIESACPPQLDEAWGKWVCEKHMPEICSHEAVKKAIRYQKKTPESVAALLKGRPLDTDAAYLTIYEFENWEGVNAYMTSKLRQEVAEDFNKNWMPKGARILGMKFYEPTIAFEK